MSRDPIIEVKDLYYAYTDSRNFVLKKISMDIYEGEIVSILGPNGSGKTTLLKILARVLNNYSGIIRLRGKDLRKYSLREYSKIISYVPQIETLTIPYTVYEYVLIGRSPYVNLFRVTSRDIRRSLEAIHLVGIEDLINRRVNELSGGETQLVRIARALAQEPKIVLMDEPTSHLDLGNKVKILKLMKILSKSNYTIIFTTHDPNEALSVSDKVYIINKGSIVSSGEPDKVITREMIEKIYSVKTIIFKNFDKTLIYPEI